MSCISDEYLNKKNVSIGTRARSHTFVKYIRHFKSEIVTQKNGKIKPRTYFGAIIA